MSPIPTHRNVSLIASDTGERLDRYLARAYPELTRTQAQRLIEQGQVTVNGQPAKPGLKLNAGDRVSAELPPPIDTTPQAERNPLNIIYEDDEVVVINKPSGLTVHPAPGHPDHTLINALLAHVPDLPAADDPERPGIVHRLDKDASGLMVVAKTRTAQLNLIGQFQQRTVDKTYLVLVKGHLHPAQGIIEAPIGRDPRHRQRMAVVEADRGKEARTEYQVSEYVGEDTLLEVKMTTGRTHQIRVHLAAIGYPVRGDRVYGNGPDSFPRLFLHAHRLGFRLPGSGEYREFVAELADELTKVLASLR